jgi:hypothetical protein
MKKNISTYSRMFLVAPTVYEKLLNCIDEKDKKSTENLNMSKDKTQRPSDDYIQELNIESFNEPREVPEHEVESGQSGEQMTESDIIYKENPSVIESESMEADTNPEQFQQLSSPCKISEQGEVIPPGGLIYRPQSSFKAVKEPVLSLPRLSQRDIDYHTKPNQPIVSLPKLSQQDIDYHTNPNQPIVSLPKLSQQDIDYHTNPNQPIVSLPKLSQREIEFFTTKPKTQSIIRKPVLSLPKLNQGEIDIYTKKSNPQLVLQKLPDLQQAQIDAFDKTAKNKEIFARKQKVIVPSIKKQETAKIKNFQCPICMKFWRSKWDLRRHTSSVHSNFRQKQSIENAQPLPDTDETMTEEQTMQQKQDEFPIWTRTRSQKRSSSQAKLPTLKPKFRPPGGDDEGEYESWK